MKRYVLNLLLALLPAVSVYAQTTAAQFAERYNLLVSKLGPTGVGIETLLDKWAAAYPDDIDMLIGKFSYYYSKSQSSSVVQKDQAKYLGEKPILSLKDTLGHDVNYFQETFYDDELFGQAQKALEQAIQANPDRLDLRFLKISAYIKYEKESPDMAASELKNLIIYNETRHPKWSYPEIGDVDEDTFQALVQEYCYTFFRYATPTSYETFKDLSNTMLNYKPESVLFLDNVGSYFLVARKDYKTAQKYYNKVLKIKKDDLTAIKNLIILARTTNDVKLEKKYLPLLEKYGETEAEKISAKSRLEFLNGKK